MGVVVSYAAALIFNALGMTNADGSAILDFTNIASAAWVGVPEFSICKFNISAILYFIRLMNFKKGGLDMKILKSILNYIPLATFIIFWLLMVFFL